MTGSDPSANRRFLRCQHYMKRARQLAAQAMDDAWLTCFGPDLGDRAAIRLGAVFSSYDSQFNRYYNRKSANIVSRSRSSTHHDHGSRNQPTIHLAQNAALHVSLVGLVGVPILTASPEPGLE